MAIVRGVGWLAIAMIACVSTAHAADRGPYLVTSAGAFAGAGFEGLNVTALGLDVTTGYRFSRWISLEGAFEGWFHTQRFGAGGGSDLCDGTVNEQWHWQTFGARMWVHAVSTRRFELAIAPPSLSGGVAYDDMRSVVPRGTICWRAQHRFSGAMVVFGLIGFSLEVKLDPHVALRLTTGAEIDIAANANLGVLAVTASLGPAFRF